MKCQWFALCDNESVGTSTTPWGEVPICQRCADKTGVSITKKESNA